jgi:hypothetical protein
VSLTASFVGPAVTDIEIMARLPDDYAEMLRDTNGFIALEGGLHVRGACMSPDWHSLRYAWEGDNSLRHLFTAVLESDIPFAQDCFGDQFLIRDGRVVRLWSETGQVDPMEMTFHEFFSNAENDPMTFLSLEPLFRYRKQGGVLEPGKLLSVYPPFCLKSQETDYSLRAIPAAERMASLAAFARQIAEVPDGQPIKIVVK